MTSNKTSLKDAPRSLPLFPLNSILCPKGVLPLRIFEQRYLHMVSACMKEGHGFVVVTIKEGNEVGGKARFFDTGTYAEIIDFQSLPGGLLGISVNGIEKVNIADAFQGDDGLYRGQIRSCDTEQAAQLPTEYQELAHLLREIERHSSQPVKDVDIDYADAREVGWRLVERLPLANPDKQYLLTITDPLYRLEQLRYLIHVLAE